VRSLLKRRGYAVAAEATCCAEALALAAELRPACALVDVNLPDGSGFELAAELKRRLPRMAVLLTSADDDGWRHARAHECGAAGFVPKAHLASCDLERFWPLA
jgi:DNA-binding NarL/FixJ family response regulator